MAESQGYLDQLLARFGMDIDDLLAYSTPKVVKVRDYRLGALNLACQLAIFFYIIIYAIYLEEGYKQFEELSVGSININARAASGRALPNDLSYCCTNEGADLINKDDPNAIPYWGNVTCPEEEYKKLPCLYWDEFDSIFPQGMDYSVAVHSRVTLTHYSFEESCGVLDYDGGENYGKNCKILEKNKTISKQSYYIAGFEDTTLLVQHGLRAQTIDAEATNTGDERTPGKIIDPDGNQEDLPINKFQIGDGVDGAFVEQSQGDILSVDEILRYAGFYKDGQNLDSVRRDLAGDDSTSRYDGMNVIVYIRYERGNSRKMSYTYRPRILNNVEFKVVTRQLLGDNETITINRHGVRIVFVQSGRIGVFSFQALLITLVSSLALLAVSSTIVNLLMTKVLGYKEFYKFSKYELTQDFSELRDDKEKFKQERELVTAINKSEKPRSAYVAYKMKTNSFYKVEGLDEGDGTDNKDAEGKEQLPQAAHPMILESSSC
eukprot:m.338581 g.338581  ORF g.338581 m.338581 type:complete len:491 (+) comp18468_c0_seq1:13-1485(+)